MSPGSSIGLHEHTQEDEIFIIQDGKGLITEQGQETEVVSGDVILTGKGESHALKNIGETPLMVTAIIIKYT